MKRILLLTYVTLLLASCSYRAVVNKAPRMAVNKGDVEVNRGGDIIVIKDANLKKVPGALKKGDNVIVKGKTIKISKK